jgi:hypothetical protein
MKRNREEELRAQANSKRSCFRVSYFIQFRKYARIKAKAVMRVSLSGAGG